MEALTPPVSLHPWDVIRFALRLLGASLCPVVVVALVWVPVSWFVDRSLPTVPDSFTQLVRTGFGLLHGSLAAALFLLIGRGRLRGEPMSPPLLLKMALCAWPRLLWTQFLAMIAIVLGFIAFVLPGIYVAIRLVAVDSVAVFEKRSGPGAMRRSFEMTRELAGDILVLALAYLGIALVVAAAYFAIASFFPFAAAWPAQAAGYFCHEIATAFFYFFLLGIYEVIRSWEPPGPVGLDTEVEAGWE